MGELIYIFIWLAWRNYYYGKRNGSKTKNTCFHASVVVVWPPLTVEFFKALRIFSLLPYCLQVFKRPNLYQSQRYLSILNSRIFKSNVYFACKS